MSFKFLRNIRRTVKAVFTILEDKRCGFTQCYFKMKRRTSREVVRLFKETIRFPRDGSLVDAQPRKQAINKYSVYA